MLSNRGDVERAVLRRFAIFAGLLVLGLIFYFINPTNEFLVAKTLFALAGLYFFFSIVLDYYISQKIREPKTRYSLRKVLTASYALIFAAAVFAIWVQDPQAVGVSIGLIGAALAFVLQDFLRNFVGGFAIFASGIYSVGDRIQVAEKRGDVVDIGLLYTTLLEIQEWVDGDQATGRLTTIPNGVAFTSVVDNYTKDFPYVWDEVSFPITADSDLTYALQRFQEIATEETREQARMAEAALTDVVMEKYYLNKREVQPFVFMAFNDDWVQVNIRYVTRVQDRRLMRSRIFQLVLEEVQRSDRIKRGMETMTIGLFRPDEVG